MKQKVVTFGDIMMRLTPERYLRFTQADRFETVLGGGEANVAVSLARFGMDAVFVTKLPEHEMGQAVVNYLRGQGVDTRCILRGGERLGLYYLERGAAQRPDKVIYDRKNSSFALSEWNEYDWDAILEEAGWLHVTGITPALSPQAEEMTEYVLKLAKKKGIPVSFDPNYRQKLWSFETAKAVVERLLPYADVCLTGLQGNAILGIRDVPPAAFYEPSRQQGEAVRMAAEEAVKAGAVFIVSPGLSEEAAAFCKEKGVPYLPGCVTPTEMMQALELGITAVKFFPAGVYGGLKALKALAAPFPALRFVPTGGVNTENLAEYLAFPRIAAVGGSWMMQGDTQAECKKIQEITGV